MAMSLEILSTQKSFGGWHKRVRHHSNVLGCDMVFAVYLPPRPSNPAPACRCCTGCRG
jgi:hypothetical protein